MKVKKMIYTALIVILVGFVLFLYNEFNGNPISKFVSKQVLEKYLTEQYPDREFRLREGVYNFKFKEYSYKVIEVGRPDEKGQGPHEYELTVRGFLSPRVSIDEIRYELLDQRLMERLSAEAEEELTLLLGQHVQNIVKIEVGLEVLQGQLQDDVEWNKDIELDEPMNLYIVLNAASATKENILQDANQIQHTLNSAGYDYSYVMINGNIFDVAGYEKVEDSYVKFAVSFAKDSVLKQKDVSEYE